MSEKRIHLWLRIKTALRAITLFERAGQDQHEQRIRANQAGKPQEAKEYGLQAEDDYVSAREFKFQISPEDAVMHDESVSGNSAPVQQVKLSPPASGRDLIWGALLALSIAVNIWCGWEIRDIGTRKWLHDYDLNQFQMGPFSKLQNDVEVTKLLVAARCEKPKEK